jgi:uncharacterized protein (DUF39 family)
MDLKDLSPELQEKAKACKTVEELKALAQENGFELSDDELDAVSGGNFGRSCFSYVTCPNAVDTRGRSCQRYTFM